MTTDTTLDGAEQSPPAHPASRFTNRDLDLILELAAIGARTVPGLSVAASLGTSAWLAVQEASR